MKPGPNKLRRIDSRDRDGSSGFQCLRCRSYIGIVERGGIEFCPFCGIRWELGHVWREPDRRVWTDEMRRLGQEDEVLVWRIERQQISPWKTDWCLIGWNTPQYCLDLVRYLGRLRVDNPGDEYRVVLRREIRGRSRADGITVGVVPPPVIRRAP